MKNDHYINEEYEENLDIDQDYWDYCDEDYDEDLRDIENADLGSTSFYSSISVSEW